jgi:iron complex outermembrane receptor protein
MPTVNELYGATSTTNSQFINDPNLLPERSWTSELTAEKDFLDALLRFTLFSENTHDSLYSQTTFDAAANRNISRVQNVGRIKTNGLEVAYSGTNVWKKGLDLSASVTYAIRSSRRTRASWRCPATPSASASPISRSGVHPLWPATGSVTSGPPPSARATAGRSFEP